MTDRHVRCIRLASAFIMTLAFCTCAHARTWHVSPVKLPDVDAELQFVSIARAAAKAEPGDTVLIHNGVYREHVIIDKSGSPDRPITFEPAVGANVTITGSDRITEWTEVPGDGHIYRTHWPHAFVGWNPQNTHPSDDYHLLIGRCEQVFINGYSLRQVLDRDKLSRGTFYVDLADKLLYAWSADNQDISDRKLTVEASTRTQILAVKGDHIAVKGMRLRYAANRAQRGAVEFSGNHITVSDCVFEYTNSSGAEFSGEDITVSRCTFQHNGQLGFGANRAHGLLMTGCTVRNNNTKNFNRGWEAGGNKICLARGVVIENSTFVENRGNGIWFDIGNEYCEVRNCLIAGNDDAGIFYEISYGLHAHDNVIISNGLADTPGSWGAAAGISVSSSPDCLIERNILFANKEGFNLREQQRTTPRIGNRKGEPVWNHDHVVRNNIIAYNRDAQTWGWFDISDDRHWPAEPGANPDALSLEKLSLKFANNLYCTSPAQDLFNWGVTWKKHKRYTKLSEVQQELNLDQGSRLAQFDPKDPHALDFCIPPASAALRMNCYPRGHIPNVKLGSNAP